MHIKQLNNSDNFKIFKTKKVSLDDSQYCTELVILMIFFCIIKIVFIADSLQDFHISIK